MFSQLITLCSPKYSETDNSHKINATIKYLLDYERFNLKNILILVIFMAD